jgi:Mrp family chromosome partitioning ATPase
MGLGLSLAHLSFDQTVRSTRQIARRLDMPLLGQVIRSNFFGSTRLGHLLPHPFRLHKKNQRNSSFFIVENGMYPETARELGATAVALKQMMDAHATQIVGLLGTTTDLNSAAVCSNLALLNARAGRRTLMIEADTASPNLQSQFAPESPNGLQDLLSGSASPADVIVPWPSNPKLSLLMAKSTGLLWTSEQNVALRAFIDQVADQYDLILVHLPHVASANRAAGAVDNVAIVSHAGKTIMPELLDITADLRLAGKQPLGVIISDLA